MIWPLIALSKQGRFRWLELYSTKEEADERKAILDRGRMADTVSDYVLLPPVELADKR